MMKAAAEAARESAEKLGIERPKTISDYRINKL